MERYTLLYSKWITRKDLCTALGTLLNLWGSLDGRGVWERIDTGICMTESLHYSLKTITTLLTDYTPTQNKKLKKKSVPHPEGGHWL